MSGKLFPDRNDKQLIATMTNTNNDETIYSLDSSCMQSNISTVLIVFHFGCCSLLLLFA